MSCFLYACDSTERLLKAEEKQRMMKEKEGDGYGSE